MFDFSGEIKLFINDEEYDFENTFEFYFHPTNFSSMKFFNVIKKINNVYPNNLLIQDAEREFTFAKVLKDDKIIFFGIINRTGRYSLIPNTIKTKAIEIADFRKWLSLSKNLEKTYFNKTPAELVSEVLKTLNESKIKIGQMNFTNNDYIKAYSLINKNAYQILKDVIPRLTNSLLIFKIEDDFLTINYKSNNELLNNISPIVLDFKDDLFFSEYKILDIINETDTSHYSNSISCTSENLLSEKFVDNRIAIFDNKTLTLGNDLIKIVNDLNFTFIENESGIKVPLEIKNKNNLQEYDYFDLAYEIGKNTVEVNEKYLKKNLLLNIRYYYKIKLTITANNTSEIKKLSEISGSNGIVARTDKYNDYSNINDLYRVLNTELEKASAKKISLTVSSNKKIWNLLDVVEVKNINLDIAGKYLVHSITGAGVSWKSDDLINYQYLLKQSFNTDNIINIFDNNSYKDNPALDEDFILETTETFDKEVFLIWNLEKSNIESLDSFFNKSLLQKNLQSNFNDVDSEIIEVNND